MQSADCRHGVSDAERPTAECEPVKEEPEWDECGVSEVAAAEGLYAGHEIKDELVIAPEQLQVQDITFSMQRTLSGTEDLCQLEPANGAALESPHTRPGEGAQCNKSHEQQLKFRNRFVKLERIIIVKSLPTYNTCHKIFDCNSNLKNHSCTITGALSKNPSNVSKQSVLASQTVEKQSLFKCDICSSSFARKQDLIKHVTITHKHSVQTPKLRKLANSFISQNNLTAHNRSHTEEKPYACDNCNKRFKYLRLLDNHKAVHSREMPFFCCVCMKKFAHMSMLSRHVRQHTGEKPFSCDVCKSRFVHKSTLLNHRRVHTDEKLFYCDICTSQFTYKSSWVKHRRNHTCEKR